LRLRDDGRNRPHHPDARRNVSARYRVGSCAKCSPTRRPAQHPTLVLQRTLFETIGGYCEDARLKTREDHDLTIRLAQKADAIAVPDILVRVRHHPGRTTSTAQSAYEQAALVYEMFLNSNPPDELARIAHRYCARELASAAKQRLSSGHLLQATVLFSRYVDHRRRRSER
jgi:hypothetical protein